MGGGLRQLMEAIAADNADAIEQLLANRPDLARAKAPSGATRADADANYLPRAGCYVYEGTTALHIAAAAYQPELVRRLADLGADVCAQDRRGVGALHLAASGNPDGPRWNPARQAQTIATLVALGADPNTPDRYGTTPLHKAIRTRCTGAVSALLEAGADRARPTRNGSSPIRLAQLTTGRGGSGSPAAKAEQAAIMRLLQERPAAA